MAANDPQTVTDRQAILDKVKSLQGEIARQKGKPQFEALVFPTELLEISKRRKTVLEDLQHELKERTAHNRFHQADLEKIQAKIGTLEKWLSEFKQKNVEETVKSREVQREKLAGLSQELERLRQEVGETLPQAGQMPQVTLAQLQTLEDDIEKITQEFTKGPQPAVDFGLVGLALSGGGIRSATESLGVLQALARYDILQDVDYLSTVSGGGYIGSCVTSLLTDDPSLGVHPGDRRIHPFPLGFRGGENEAPAVQHLRAYSNYLAPQHGVFKLDTWRMIGWYVGTLIFNLLTPFFATIFLLTLGTLVTQQLWRDSFVGGIPWLLCIVITVTVLYLGYFITLYRADSKQARDSRSKLVGHVAAALVVPAFLFAAPALYDHFVKLAWRAQPVSVETLKNRLELTGLKKSGEPLVSGQITELVKALRWSGAWISDAPATEKLLTEGLNKTGASQSSGHFEAKLPEVLSDLERVGLSFGEGSGVGSWLVPILTLLAGVIPAAYLGYIKGSLPVFGGVLLGFIGIVVLAHLLGALYDPVCFLVIAMGSLFLAGCFGYIDINANSLLNFYRDRLADCYIIATKKHSGTSQVAIKTSDDLKLKDILPSSNGPYHLINATLNLSGSGDLWLRGRMADMFLFAKDYCGSHRTGVGYIATAAYRYKDKDLTLADAMAISASAFNSQMGASTTPGRAALLALLNVRLGRWLPNPNLDRQRKKTSPVWWNKYFVKELFSLVTEKDEFVLLTDGGHFENMGVYTLLQRRCQTIIAVDNGADPNREFEDLAGVLRKARIDLGIQIDLDLGQLHGNQKTKRAACGFAEGTILYPEGAQGRLIYLKPTMTGKESEDILQYDRKHGDFPQETTLDQFFDEAQFESYRELSYQLTKQAIAKNHFQNLGI